MHTIKINIRIPCSISDCTRGRNRLLVKLVSCSLAFIHLKLKAGELIRSLLADLTDLKRNEWNEVDE